MTMHDDPPSGEAARVAGDSLDVEALFVAETEKDLSELIRAVGDEDRASISFIAHRLRGRGRIMGFLRFEELAGNLESMADDGDFPALSLALDALRSRFEELSA